MNPSRYVALVDELLTRPAETEWLEFKRENYDPERMGRTISALSNSARLCDEPYAYLVWGVANDRTIVGTQYEVSTETHKNQPLEMWLR